MGVLKLIQITFALGGFIILAFVANGYHRTQHEAVLGTGVESKFVGRSGQIERMGEKSPSMIETARTFVNGMLGREEKPKSSLSQLRKRQAFNAQTPQERYNAAGDAEIQFWTGLFSKIGLGGP